MLNRFILGALISVLGVTSVTAEIKWTDPLTTDSWKVEGRIWDEKNFNRLPVKAKALVRPAVWSLSQQSAGLRIRFWSNSPEIHLQYELGGNLAMPHMPATGVSGFDLYCRSKEAGMDWVAATKPSGKKGTVRLVGGLTVHPRVPRLYTLYLPLYNSVKSLKIGVPTGKTLQPAKPDQLKPIVVYGTSIAQGACASRPGLAWTNILQRRLDYPVVNLGFSGNGRLESEVAELFSEKDAAVYVIDCLPNMNGAKAVADRIKLLIETIRAKRPKTPILLVEEAPRDNSKFFPAQKKALDAERAALRLEYERRKAIGEPIYYLKGDELLGSDGEATVDAVHPNDIGMMRIARAYEKVLRPILQLDGNPGLATRATSQLREIPGYNFMARHQAILKRHQEVKPDVVWLGDSIIHFFGGEPIAPYVRGKLSWERLFKGKKVTNLAYGWDRTENVMWRIQRGELGDIKPSAIVLSIGTNDLSVSRSVGQVVNSILGLAKEIKRRQPNAKLVVTGIIPRKDFTKKRLEINALLEKFAEERGYLYVDLDAAFPTVEKNGKKMIQGLMGDQLHPNEEGYEELSQRMKKLNL